MTVYLTTVARYKQVKYQINLIKKAGNGNEKEYENLECLDQLRYWNLVATYHGVAQAVFCSLIGAFRLSECFILHFPVAMSAFVEGLIFAYYQVRFAVGVFLLLFVFCF